LYRPTLSVIHPPRTPEVETAAGGGKELLPRARVVVFFRVAGTSTPVLGSPPNCQGSEPRFRVPRSPGWLFRVSRRRNGYRYNKTLPHDARAGRTESTLSKTRRGVLPTQPVHGKELRRQKTSPKSALSPSPACSRRKSRVSQGGHSRHGPTCCPAWAVSALPYLLSNGLAADRWYYTPLHIPVPPSTTLRGQNHLPVGSGRREIPANRQKWGQEALGGSKVTPSTLNGVGSILDDPRRVYGDVQYCTGNGRERLYRYGTGRLNRPFGALCGPCGVLTWSQLSEVLPPPPLSRFIVSESGSREKSKAPEGVRGAEKGVWGSSELDFRPSPLPVPRPRVNRLILPVRTNPLPI
jgi:hypothetical protein